MLRRIAPYAVVFVLGCSEPPAPTPSLPPAVAELRQRMDAAYAILHTGGTVSMGEASGLGDIASDSTWFVALASQRFPCPIYQSLDMAERADIDAIARRVASDLRAYPEARADAFRVD